MSKRRNGENNESKCKNEIFGGGDFNPPDDRICIYDNIRFLLIVLTVVGHVIDLNTGQSKVFRSIFVWIYSFHMPLFLYLSGMFHTNRNILAKVSGYVAIGLLWKIVYFLEKLLLTGKASFSLLSDNGVPWYMFVLAIYIMISYGLRNMNKRFIMAFSIMVACFVGYDAAIGDYLYLSRAIVFYPFFVLGEMTDKDLLVAYVQNKWLKVLAFSVLAGWGLLCLLDLNHTYVLRPLFTGRNPFSVNEIFSKWGFAFRILCYIISLFGGFAVICVTTNRRLPVITLFGGRTLQIYFWHYFVIAVLTRLQINTFFMESPVRRVLWLLCAVLLAVILGWKPFGFPAIQIMKACVPDRSDRVRRYQ